ncbi:MAG: CPBP family intramembrane metalloprotease [Thaumarchaeota archaeon]|nr:CPBP family intramembrane metalloprotease [Candidatus Geocrenenecus arthurdayi]
MSEKEHVFPTLLAWLTPVMVMLGIRLPWLLIAGAERFFIPPSELEFYIGQSTKYFVILTIMLLMMFRQGMKFRDIGLSSSLRLVLSEILTGGVFALFYILVTWILSVFFIQFMPEQVEEVTFSILYGYIIPMDKALEFAYMLNPWVYAFYMTIIPSVIEETYFRGYSINILKRIFKNLWIVNLLQTILFSFLHWYRGILAGILPMFLFGFLFGFVTIRNGYRLTSALTGHLATNALSTFLYLRGLQTAS